MNIKSIFTLTIVATSLVIFSCKKEEDNEPQDQNTAPVAVDDDKTAYSPGTTTFSVITNDSDADGDSIFVSAVGAPSIGTTSITADGKISYEISTTHSGTVTFDYTLSDGSATTTATVTLTVQSGPPCCMLFDMYNYTGLNLKSLLSIRTNQDCVKNNS